MNQVTLMGLSGSDVEINKTQSGLSVCTISLATSKPIGQGPERKYETTWHRVVIWGNKADLIGPQIKKGTKLFIQGEMVYREYLDKNQTKRYIAEVNSRVVEIIQKTFRNPEQQQPASGDEFSENDIPF